MGFLIKIIDVIGQGIFQGLSESILIVLRSGWVFLVLSDTRGKTGDSATFWRRLKVANYVNITTSKYQFSLVTYTGEPK